MLNPWCISFHKQIFLPSDLFRLNINKLNHFKIQLHGFLNVKYVLSSVVLFIKLCNFICIPNSLSFIHGAYTQYKHKYSRISQFEVLHVVYFMHIWEFKRKKEIFYLPIRSACLIKVGFALYVKLKK